MLWVWPVEIAVEADLASRVEAEGITEGLDVEESDASDAGEAEEAAVAVGPKRSRGEGMNGALEAGRGGTREGMEPDGVVDDWLMGVERTEGNEPDAIPPCIQELA